ncbi:MAG: methyl-accepting chemotaxis protein [Prochloraceae cyanobacterium]|nr:methyl-accepting chemotaxis protein [Prochloraceae cyanobacterium]
MTQTPAKPDSQDRSENNILPSQTKGNPKAEPGKQPPGKPPSSRKSTNNLVENSSVWQSMRVKAISIAIAIGTIPAMGIGLLYYHFTDRMQNSLKQEIREHQIEIANYLSNKINLFAQERILRLELIASSPILADPNAIATVTSQQKQAWLNRSLEGEGGFYQSLAIFNLEGKLILESKSQSSNFIPGDYKRSELLKLVRENPDEAIILQTTDSNNHPIYIIAKQIKQINSDRALGIVAGQIGAQRLQEIFQIKRANGSEQKYRMVDGNDKIVLSSQQDEVGTSIGEILKKSANKLQEQQNDPEKTEKYSIVEEGNKIIIKIQVEKPEKMAQLDWSLIVSNQIQNTFTYQAQLLNILLLGTGVVALIVASIAYYLADRATRPIIAAAGAVTKIGEGQLDTRLPVKGKDEVATLSGNINQMAAQLETLIGEQEFLAKQSRLLTKISSYPTTSKEDGENILNQSLEGAREILQLERVVIYCFHPDGSGYIANQSLESGWPDALNYEIKDPCISPNLLEEYLQGRVVPTADVKKTNWHPDHLQLMEQLEIKANLVVPVINQGGLYGLLIAHHCANTHEWQQREIDFMKQLAAQLGLVLERVTFIDEREEESKRSEALKEITLKISSSFNPELIFENTVKDVRQTLQTDRVLVYTFDENWSGTVIAESVAEKWPRALGVEIADPCFARDFVKKYKEGRVQATPDIYKANLTNCHLQQLEPFSVKANIVAPILVDGELLGLLIGHQCSSTRNWEQTEVDFFSQIATQIGLALERINLLEQQKNAKEQIEKRALELLMEVDPVSKGDLTISARVTEDEIGTVADFYNATIENLRKIVIQVQGASKEVTTTTNKNKGSVQALSAGATQQRKEIEAALEQIKLMTSSIRAVADNAKQAELSVQQATQTVEEGEQAMNRTVDGMVAIRETVAETAKKVKRLGESSQKISRVVSLINSFAEQTNLLALNASIEAAHAGEEGRGFAVVAHEVRSLAAQSAEATAEIEKLIADIQAETNEVVGAMEAGTSQVVNGTKLVDETRSSLDKIASASSQINQLVKDIASAAEEQAQTSAAVNQRIAEVAAISNQTSSEAQLVSDCFSQLLSVANALQDSVGQFKVN